MQYFIVFFTVIIFTNINAQKKQNNELNTSLIGKESNVNMYHQEYDLEKLPKDILVKLYTKRVIAVIELLPFSALNSDHTRTLEALGIPNNKNNNKKLNNYIKKKIEFEKHLEHSMLRTICYAEKKELIAFILYYETIIDQLKQHIH